MILRDHFSGSFFFYFQKESCCSLVSDIVSGPKALKIPTISYLCACVCGIFGSLRIISSTYFNSLSGFHANLWAGKLSDSSQAYKTHCATYISKYKNPLKMLYECVKWAMRLQGALDVQHVCA